MWTWPAASLGHVRFFSIWHPHVSWPSFSSYIIRQSSYSFPSIWQELLTDSWVLNIVRLSFVAQPPPSQSPIVFSLQSHLCFMSCSDRDASKISNRNSARPSGSRILYLSFSDSKESVGGRGFDLSALNKYLIVPHFKMETVHSILHAMHPNEWACSMDLMDAFYLQHTSPP